MMEKKHSIQKQRTGVDKDNRDGETADKDGPDNEGRRQVANITSEGKQRQCYLSIGCLLP